MGGNRILKKKSVSNVDRKSLWKAAIRPMESKPTNITTAVSGTQCIFDDCDIMCTM